MTGPADHDASFAANRRLWDAWTAVHADAAFYDLAGFREGGVRLRPDEIAASATSPASPCSTSSATSASIRSHGHGSARR
jgi:hypothetical protein